MLTLSAETEALVRARAAAVGKTPDEVVREAFGRAPPAEQMKRGRVDWDGLRKLQEEFARARIVDSRGEKEITDEGWGM